jgi:hypothetical protein
VGRHRPFCYFIRFGTLQPVAGFGRERRGVDSVSHSTSAHIAKISLILHWQLDHSVQSNSVSGALLQKTAILPKLRGDFRYGGRTAY